MSESNLEDRGAIHDLFTRYCCALDDGEVEAMVERFTVDAILKSPVIDISGRDEIRAFAGRYACELIKEDSGQWRFSRRTVFHDHDYTLNGISR